MKMAKSRKSKKEDWFSHETGLVFAHGDVSETDLGTLPHLRWGFLQQLVMVGFTTNGQ